MSIFRELQKQGLAVLRQSLGEDVSYQDHTLAEAIAHPQALVTNEMTITLERGKLHTRDVTLLRSIVANPILRGRVTINSVEWSIDDVVSQDTVRTIVRVKRHTKQEGSQGQPLQRSIMH